MPVALNAVLGGIYIRLQQGDTFLNFGQRLRLIKRFICISQPVGYQRGGGGGAATHTLGLLYFRQAVLLF